MFIISILGAIPYYYNPKIHTLGNIGLGGKIHAFAAPFARRMIDQISYKGVNIREDIMSDYSDYKVLDLCCGIGDSTPNFGTGIDTSREMISVANYINKDSNFIVANAETYKPNTQFDIVTCMFAFHEMPLSAQYRVIENAIDIAKQEIIIVDIASNYQPKKIMLDGEPYLLKYLDTIDNTLSCFDKINYIDNHVAIWKYKI
ncbi:Methyltransferase domain protein containing [Chrysochromulina ericina virus CeV-01B]|jgi:SAM-dependent methyltransferase|uniref:Methyltransferase domain protein containing n=1 Tax=Chrysochromulina ericina virus CeV-01B TaxID=3070830 RepID=A0A0N7G7L4_9VIRU|nr:Methyltransferase domain protein containing [Chrysochromulina ericina virus]ALH23113.1 Methyltransferase domain protein containing [Chrysochromulina ericina virus CeV-01B]|tara:strand:- start:1201 stop:1806 length:606 start_codon:yes stop_codon:yes gene_type:complete